VVADSGFDTTFDISALVRSIFTHDDFYLTAAGEPYGSSTLKSVKWPVDYVASTLRLLQMKPTGKDFEIPGGSFSRLIDHLSSMGQVLGDPPNVFGWDWEQGWVSSATLLARYNFPRDIGNDPGSGLRLALHPGFASLKQLYELGKVAVIQGCGYPDYNLSHDQSRTIWETANPLGLSSCAVPIAPRTSATSSAPS
jgi:hypothetical protein